MTRLMATALALSLTLLWAAPAAAQRETETVERTLTMPPGGTLKLKTFSGRVRITGAAGNQLVVKAVRRATRDRLRDITLEIVQEGSRVEIDANHRLVERDNDNVVETDFDIQVPARTRLDIRTFSAPVTVVGVGGAHIIEGFSSEIAVESREWTDGDDVDIKTFSGDITLGLSDSARGNVSFDSFSGRFESDLPVTLASSSRRRFQGSLGSGGATDFRLKTFSGDVRIRK